MKKILLSLSAVIILLLVNCNNNPDPDPEPEPEPDPEPVLMTETPVEFRGTWGSIGWYLQYYYPDDTPIPQARFKDIPTIQPYNSPYGWGRKAIDWAPICTITENQLIFHRLWDYPPFYEPLDESDFFKRDSEPFELIPAESFYDDRYEGVIRISFAIPDSSHTFDVRTNVLSPAILKTFFKFFDDNIFYGLERKGDR